MNTKAGAAEYETLLRLRLVRGEPIEEPDASSPTTFAEFAAEWLATYVAANNKPSEQQTKEMVLRRHLLPVFGSRTLESIGRRDVELYKASKLAEKLHPKTINNHLVILGTCLRMAEEWERIERAPHWRLLRVPPPRFDFLSASESQQLLADTTERMFHDMALVALHTGLRRGELLALERGDVDFDRRILTVSRSRVNNITGSPKSNRWRHIPLTVAALDAFARARRKHYTFGPEDGSRPLSKSVAARGLRRLCARSGMRRLGWHVLRHTFASDLVAAGVPLTSIQNLMGHASVTMTMRYAHLAPTALRSAVDSLEEHIAEQADARNGQPAGTDALTSVPRPKDRPSHSSLNQHKTRPFHGARSLEPAPGIEPGTG